jgi:hypothetical protein
MEFDLPLENKTRYQFRKSLVSGSNASNRKKRIVIGSLASRLVGLR